jgi:uncharacterized protein
MALRSLDGIGDTSSAMSRENVELVRGAFEAFGTGGVEAALPYFSPSFVWYTTDRWLEGSAYRGHDGLRELAAAFSENFDNWGYGVQDVRAAGDRVVALAEMTGQIKNSGTPISQPLGLVIANFHDSMLGEIRAYPSWSEALAAAGLSE